MATIKNNSVSENKVSVIKLQSEVNNALKAEHKSLTSLLKVMNNLKSTEVMKRFLDAANLTFEQLTNVEYFDKALTKSEFTNVAGETFTCIARKDHKSGEMKPAKWSFWLILNAARKVRKNELKEAAKAAMLAKEASLKTIEEEEKTKKGSKKEESK